MQRVAFHSVGGFWPSAIVATGSTASPTRLERTEPFRRTAILRLCGRIFASSRLMGTRFRQSTMPKVTGRTLERLLLVLHFRGGRGVSGGRSLSRKKLG